jgi:hypothetical protein
METPAQNFAVSSGSKSVLKKKNAEILFDPATKEFVVVNPSDIEELKKEVSAFDAFVPYMKVFFSEEKGKQKENAARIGAILFCLKEFVDAKDEKKSKEIIDGLAKKIEEKQKELITKENIASPNKLKDGDIKEYYHFKEQRRVRLRATKTKPAWRTYPLDTKALNEEINKRKARAEKKISNEEALGAVKKHLTKPLKEESAESKIFETKLLENDKTFCELFNLNFFEGVDQLDAGISAQMFRFAVEAKIGSAFDLSKREIKISAKAEASVALAQAKGHFTIYFPEKNGFDLIKVLRSEAPDFIDKNAKPIYLMIKINLEGSGFIGICASVGLEAGVTLNNPKSEDNKGNTAKTEASIELFAGAKVGAEATISANMKLISDNRTVAQVAEWNELTSFTWGAWAAIGVGLEVAYKIGYWDGRFRMVAKAGLVLKGGAGTYIKASIDPLKIGQLIWTIGCALDWQHMSSVLEGKVHDLYQSIMVSCFYTGRIINDVVEEMSDDLDKFMTLGAKFAESELGLLKSLDDACDENVPGYSGFKKLSAGFWILKSAYHYLKENNAKNTKKENAISAVHNADILNSWQYATWQIKSNLLCEMSTGSTLLQGDKQNAMMIVIHHIGNKFEMGKIMADCKSRKVFFENELDSDQLAELKFIKTNLHYQE